MINKQYTIWCDGCENDTDCPVWIQETAKNQEQMRKSVKAFGWTNVKNKDYCPKHSTSSKND